MKRPGAAGTPPVMSDVARLAGVSHMTVSRVLNEPWRVRPATRERVEAAISELGYRPNVAARSLATRRTGTIGVAALSTTLFGPSSMLHGIEDAAREAGYLVVVAVAEQPTPEGVRDAVARLLDQGVDGLALVAAFDRVAGAATVPDGVPVVVMGGRTGEGPPSVGVDQALGSRLAVEHLLGLGHATVHHVAGPPSWTEAVRRVEGWRSALRDAGRAVPAELAGGWSLRSGQEAGHVLAGMPGVTAVHVANDHMALGLLHAFHERGVRVPGDVSVVGFDDVPEAAYLTPPLTTVRQDFRAVGEAGMRLLVRQMAGETPAEPHVVLPPELVVRQSTAAPRPERPPA